MSPAAPAFRRTPRLSASCILKRRIAAALLAVGALSAAAGAFATPAPDNPRLAMLAQEDQADRADPATRADVPRLRDRDTQRREAVLALVRDGQLHSAADYYSAALVMQHGLTADDFRLAHALATLATVLDPDNGAAKWLVAASWDRLLMRSGQPQWYGTQFTRDAQGHWHLYPVAPGAVSDADRARLGLRTLEAAKAREALLDAAGGPMPPHN